MSRDEIMIINKVFIHNVKLLWFKRQLLHHHTESVGGGHLLQATGGLGTQLGQLSIFPPDIRSELLLFLYMVQGRASEVVAEVFKASYLEMVVSTVLELN